MAEETLGARLRALRTSRGLSLRQLADRSGVDFAHIRLIEENKHEPRSATKRKLATGLGVSPEGLEPAAKRSWKADFLSDPSYSAEFKKTIVQLMEQEERRLLDRRRRK